MSEVRRSCTITVNVVAQDEAYLPEPADLATALMLVLPEAWTGPPPADGFTVEGILGKGLMPDIDPPINVGPRDQAPLYRPPDEHHD